MRYRLHYKIYRRKFSRPVRFGKAWMEHRDGIIVRLVREDGADGFGEIAPLESFGSESVEKAELLLKSFHGSVGAALFISEEEYPCTSYALQCAMRQIQDRSKENVCDGEGECIPTSRLIQNDAFDQVEMPNLRQIVITDTLKIKIGDGTIEQPEEMLRIEKAVHWCRSRGKKIRLDANEQLDMQAAQDWIDFLSPYPDTIEFIEQPMDRCLLYELAELSRTGAIPIALDESVATLRYQEDFPWKDDFLYVIKPSLGDLSVVEACGIPADRMILSSVFETAIGFSELLNLPYRNWIAGFDTQGIFQDDGLSYPVSEAGYVRRQINSGDLWKRLL